MNVRDPAQRKPAPAAQMPLALYQQVKDHVLRKIGDGSLAAGARVPSEQELVNEFGVARMTVNRALRELAEQGVIVRVAGVGSFVAEEKPQSTLLRIANIGEEITQRGHDHRFELLDMRRESASPEVAAALDLAVGASVFHLHGVHFENELPVQIEDRYVNPRLVPDFMDQDFSAVQPSVYLVRNVQYDQIEHVVDAILPTAEQARLLQMALDQPCLMLTRRTWLRGVPITWVHCVHPGMRYRLGSRFRTDSVHGG
ncbi:MULTISPECIES: histidine utilization repressor [Comamonas]|uniref:Histidine utilization repressor n=1 Tax=Comamonas thiooxydans TaxID=363952 RepID=A0A096FB75_9BURK|nr:MULTISPECIES: histidine utilization repressor [Comamonas]KGG84611.1 histidine utilization repressor [Comamonas thiooxydans]KGG87215.1 histidine utilization repressor [Comamonas thiooxydans]KGG95976.1 histidine utilization repressor [Comamonas thiooxydans]KGH02360.1 histidine utilization repressor [Comamonas thiooxydans]KGH09629.1 histidine utilization repressor [Comamonas thiooxydans]